MRRVYVFMYYNTLNSNCVYLTALGFFLGGGGICDISVG